MIRERLLFKNLIQKFFWHTLILQLLLQLNICLATDSKEVKCTTSPSNILSNLNRDVSLLVSPLNEKKKLVNSHLLGEPSNRFYDRYLPFNEIVSLSLDHRGRESNIPLMNFLKDKLKIEVAETIGKDFWGTVHKLCFPISRQELKTELKKIFPHKKFSKLYPRSSSSDIHSSEVPFLNAEEQALLLKHLLGNKIKKDNALGSQLYKNLQKFKTAASNSNYTNLELEEMKGLIKKSSNLITRSDLLKVLDKLKMMAEEYKTSTLSPSSLSSSSSPYSINNSAISSSSVNTAPGVDTIVSNEDLNNQNNQELIEQFFQMLGNRQIPITPQLLVKMGEEMLGSFDRSKGRHLEYYFNFLDDEYGEKLMQEFLADPFRKKEVIERITNWSNKQLAQKILKQLGVMDSRIPEEDRVQFFNDLLSVIKNVDAHGTRLQKSLQKLISNQLVTKGMIDLKALASQLYLRTDVFNDDTSQFSLENVSDETKFAKIKDKIKTKINRMSMSTIKHAIYEEVIKYDGLIEHATPATIRGLHSRTFEEAVKIATHGDFSSVYDLFRYEVASKARSSKYQRGHTGPSNRSTTLSPKIATYFATKHALNEGIPDSVWFFIYEGGTGIYMSEIEPEGEWREAEIGVPYLMPEWCLGAVQFKVANANTDNFLLEAVDGFLTPSGREKKDLSFSQLGMLEEIYKYFILAKHFDEAHLKGGQKKRLSSTYEVKRRFDKNLKDENDKKQASSAYKKYLFEYDSITLKNLLPTKGIPKGHFRYKLSRMLQRKFAALETKTDKEQRLQKERTFLSQLTGQTSDNSNVSNNNRSESASSSTSNSSSAVTSSASSTTTNASIPSSNSLFLLTPERVANELKLQSRTQSSANTLATISPDYRKVEEVLVAALNKHYRKPFPAPVRGVRKNFTNSPFYSGRLKDDYEGYLEQFKTRQVAREKHGSAHAARTTLWTLILSNYLNQLKVEIPSKEKYKAAYSAIFHDSGREDEGVDVWEEDSANALRDYGNSSKNSFTNLHNSIEEMSSIIVNKDKVGEFDPFTKKGQQFIATALVHDADALEIMRIRDRRLFSSKSKDEKRSKGFDHSNLLIFNKLQSMNKISATEALEFTREVQTFIDLTERAEIKEELEKSDTPIELLLNIMSKHREIFPLLYSNSVN